MAEADKKSSLDAVKVEDVVGPSPPGTAIEAAEADPKLNWQTVLAFLVCIPRPARSTAPAWRGCCNP
jgi:hypothetical protein